MEQTLEDLRFTIALSERPEVVAAWESSFCEEMKQRSSAAFKSVLLRSPSPEESDLVALFAGRTKFLIEAGRRWKPDWKRLLERAHDELEDIEIIAGWVANWCDQATHILGNPEDDPQNATQFTKKSAEEARKAYRRLRFARYIVNNAAKSGSKFNELSKGKVAMVSVQMMSMRLGLVEEKCADILEAALDGKPLKDSIRKEKHPPRGRSARK